MPVYEYQCRACGQEFEYQQRMSDPDKTACESCGGDLARMMSLAAVQARGGYASQELAAASCGPDGTCDPAAASAWPGGCGPGGCGVS